MGEMVRYELEGGVRVGERVRVGEGGVRVG